MIMNVDCYIHQLEDKDTSIAYEALKALEKLSDSSNSLYPCLPKFIEMLDSEKYVIRVRGFRLFCKQAKWDVDGVIDRNLENALAILQDEKPTAVRQALAALMDLVPYKKELHDCLRARVLEIDPFRYKDTMHSLLAKDMAALLKRMEET